MASEVKILSIRATDFQRIELFQWEGIPPNLSCIGGNNEQGKSSAINAFCALFDASAGGTQAVRKGSDKAEVVGVLGDAETGEALYTIKRTYKPGKSPLLTVHAHQDGMRKGAQMSAPATFLDTLASGTSVAFDPLAFPELPAQKQVEMLRDVVDYSKVEELDALIAVAYESRTDAGREAKRAAAVVSEMPAVEGAPKELAAVADLVSQLQISNDMNIAAMQAKENAEREVQYALENVARLDADVKRLEDELREAKQMQAEAMAASSRATIALNECNVKTPPVDIEPLQKQIEEAEGLNTLYRQAQERKKAVAHAQELQALHDEAEQNIQDLRKRRAAELAEINWPVDGMDFDAEHGVTLNGIALSNCSASERDTASVKIALSRNAKLRAMFTRHGERLDDNRLKAWYDLAKEHNLQLIIERVGKGLSNTIIIEDGKIEDNEDPVYPWELTA